MLPTKRAMDLIAAAERSGRQEVALLLDHGANVNAQGGRYRNAFQAAAARGDQETVRLLLDRGADVTVQPRNTNRLSLIHVYITSNSIEALKILIHAGAAIYLTIQDESGQTPLHLAVEKQDITAAKYLLEKGASTNIPDLSDATSF